VAIQFVSGSGMKYPVSPRGILAAMRSGFPAARAMRMASSGPFSAVSRPKKRLEPHIDGQTVQLVGEVDEAKKQPFLAEAAALLFPIDWPEPFGLVMIEAMACGTPVIAYRAGSVPEVIEDGVTGFIVENEEQAVRAVRDLGRLDRRTVRERFEERFSASRMAREYERCYRGLMGASATKEMATAPCSLSTASMSTRGQSRKDGARNQPSAGLAEC
jgi:hypothetical protein